MDTGLWSRIRRWTVGTLAAASIGIAGYEAGAETAAPSLDDDAALRAVERRARSRESQPGMLPAGDSRTGFVRSESERCRAFIRSYDNVIDDFTNLELALYLLTRGSGHGNEDSNVHTVAVRQYSGSRLDTLFGNRIIIFDIPAGSTGYQSIRELVEDDDPNSMFSDSTGSQNSAMVTAAQEVLDVMGQDGNFSAVQTADTNMVLPHEVLRAMMEAYRGVYEHQSWQQRSCGLEGRLESTCRVVQTHARDFEERRSTRSIEPDDRPGLGPEEVQRLTAFLQAYSDHITQISSLRRPFFMVARGNTSRDLNEAVTFSQDLSAYRPGVDSFFTAAEPISGNEVLQGFIAHEDSFPGTDEETRTRMYEAAQDVLQSLGLDDDYSQDQPARTRIVMPTEVIIALIEAYAGIYQPQPRPEDESSVTEAPVAEGMPDEVAEDEPETPPEQDVAQETSEVTTERTGRSRTGRYHLSFGPVIGVGGLAHYSHAYPEEELMQMGTVEESIPAAFLLGGAFRLEWPNGISFYFSFASDYGRWHREQALDRYAQGCGGSRSLESYLVDDRTVLRDCEEMRTHLTQHRVMTLFQVGGEYTFDLRNNMGITFGGAMSAGYTDSSMVETTTEDVTIASDSITGFGDWLIGSDCSERIAQYETSSVCLLGESNTTDWSGRTDLMGASLALGVIIAEYFSIRMSGGFLIGVNGPYRGEATAFFELGAMARLPVSREFQLQPGRRDRRQGSEGSASLPQLQAYRRF